MNLGTTMNETRSSALTKKTLTSRQQLLETLQSEEKQLKTLLEEFYRQPRSSESCLTCANHIVVLLDRIFSAGDWEESLFLRNTAKPLRKIYEDAQEAIQKLQGNSAQNYTLSVLQEDEKLLFISLFQSQGLDLRKWEAQLNSIDRYLLGRPIYFEEADVARAIRIKAIQTAEAYCSMVIKKAWILNDLLRPPRLDRNGRPLVNVKPGQIRSEYIREFVHQGDRYYFVNGKLLLREN